MPTRDVRRQICAAVTARFAHQSLKFAPEAVGCVTLSAPSLEQTAKHFGAPITSADINKAKAAGGANNDWKLTHTLVHTYKGTDGASPSLQEITEKFEELYQGDACKGQPGCWCVELEACVRVRACQHACRGTGV